MKTSTKFLRNMLLAGTALVAVSLTSQAQAAGNNLVANANTTWASNGKQDGLSVPSATAGDNVDITVGGVTLTVTNDGANDGGGTDSFTLGTVTDSGGSGNLTVITNNNGNQLTTTIGSANVGGNVTFEVVDGSIGNRLVANVTDALTVGGALSINNKNVTGAQAATVTVGTLNVVGPTTISVGNLADSTAALIVNGNANFVGGVTVAGNNGNANNASSLTLNGATNVFAGGLNLITNTGGAVLNINGNKAQTVTGTITGDGQINVANSAGVVFSGGAVTANNIKIENSAGDSKATFNGDVTASITLGGDNNFIDNNVVIFDSTNGNITFNGAIAGVGANEFNQVFAVGGKTVSFTGGAVATNIDQVQVVGSGTLLTTNQNIKAEQIIVNDGATLETTANTITDLGGGLILGQGSVLKMAGGNVEGEVFASGGNVGQGTIQVTASGTLEGGVGIGGNAIAAVIVEDNQTLTFDVSGLGSHQINANTLTLASNGVNDATLAITLGNDAFINTKVITTVNGTGVITGSGAARNIFFAEDVGTNAARLKSITLLDDPSVSGIVASKNLYVNTITLGQNDTLLLNGNNIAQIVSGDINGSGSKGNVVVGDATHKANVTFQGVLGGAGTLANVTIASGSVANVSKNISTNTANAAFLGFDSEGTLNIDSSAGAVAIVEAVGISKFNGVTNIFGSTPTVGDVTLAGGSELKMDGTLNVDLQGAPNRKLTLDGDVINLGTVSGLNIATSNQILALDDVNFGKAGISNTFAFKKTLDFDPALTTALQVNGGSLTINNNAANPLNIVFAPRSVEFDNNEQITLFHQDVVGTDLGAALKAGNIILTDTVLTDLQDDASDASNLKIKLVHKDANLVLNNQGGNAVNALLAIPSAVTDDTLGTIRGILESTDNLAEANAIADTLTPTVDGSASTELIDTEKMVQRMNESRLDALRVGQTSGTGVAAGNPLKDTNVWIQGFGRASDQDAKDGVAGYEAETYGGSLGVDSTKLFNRVTVGIAFDYARTEADSENTGRAQTDINRYGVSVYGSTNALGHQLFLNGQAGYAYHEVETLRQNVGLLGLNANGDTHSHLFDVKAQLGRDFDVYRGLTVTPTLSANYLYLFTNQYTESGANSASLAVRDDHTNVFDLGVGATVGWKMKLGSTDTVLTPSLSAGYTYDVVGDRIDIKSAFVGGGAPFETRGAGNERSEGTVGAGLSLATGYNWDVSANYDYTFREDYKSSSGHVRLTAKF